LQQDKESFGSDTSHEEKVFSFFEDVANLAFVLYQAEKRAPLNEVSLFPGYNGQ